MKALARFIPMIVGLAFLLTTTPSQGTQPPDPTDSDANENTAGGTGALLNVQTGTPTCGTDIGCANTAFGFQALTVDTTGSANVATGASALNSNSTGSFNTASGTNALFNNTTGNSNVANGASALNNNNIGSSNTASGMNALFANTTGNLNTATGSQALFSNIDGTDNTASGAQALSNNSSGNLNTAAGFQALTSNAAGGNNTAVGAKALKKSTGNKNIGIGYQAGASLAAGNSNIYIGNPGASSESQTMRFGSTQTRTFIAGIATAGVSGAAVEVDTVTGQLGIATSSARFKRDIAPMGTGSEKLLRLRPVTFAYKDDGQGVTHYGLIAEEVAVVFPELVTRTATGEVQAVRYQELIPMLLNELQRQQRELAELRALMGQRRGAELEPSFPGPTIAVGGAPSAAR